MIKIFTLVKVMLKNTSTALESGKKKQSKLQKGLMALGAFALFISLSVSFYFMSKDILLSLQENALESLAIQILLLGTSAYLLVVSVILVPTVFYFSKDVEHLLSLPLKPFEILSAKAITSYVNLLISISFIVLPFGLAYQFILKPELIFSLFYLLSFLILPMVPLALSILFVVTIFTFIPKVYNKDLFTYFTSFLMFVMIFALNINTGFMEDPSSLINPDGLGALSKMAKVIPSLGLLILSVTTFDFLALLGALAFSLGLTFLSVKVIDNLYFKGVLSAQGSSSTKKKSKSYKNSHKNDSQLIALMRIDFKKILRTPSLAINYLLPIIILPLFMVVPLLFSLDSSDLEMIKAFLTMAQGMIKNLDVWEMMPYLISFSFIGTYLFSSFSTISATAISREGESMLMYKSMPLSMMTLVKSKILLGMLVGAIFPILLALIVLIVFRLHILAWPAVFISIFTALVFANSSDIITDLIKPKLEWDDEVQAVKQNFVSIIPVFASFGILALYVFLVLKFDPLMSASLILVGSGLFALINLKILIPKYGIKKLNQAIEKL